MCDLLPSRKMVFHLIRINYAFKLQCYMTIFIAVCFGVGVSYILGVYYTYILGGIDNASLVRYGR